MTLFSLWLNVLNCFELLKNLLLPSKNKSTGVVVAQKHKCFNKSVSSWSQLRLHNIWRQKATKFYEVSLYLRLYVPSKFYMLLLWYITRFKHGWFTSCLWRRYMISFKSEMMKCLTKKPYLQSNITELSLDVCPQHHFRSHIHTPTNIHTAKCTQQILCSSGWSY